MISALGNHLWQSTLFAVLIGILTLAFRNNRAHIRYCLWLAASLKFLLPFAPLIRIGERLLFAPAAQGFVTTIPAPMSFTMVEISEPFAVRPLPAQPPVAQAAHPFDWFLPLVVIWAFGVLVITWMRWRSWLRLQSVVKASTPMDIPALQKPQALQICSSPEMVEPGVVGWLRPILLLPADIQQRLPEQQLEAVLAHEFCHVRRRDNLISAFHMLVEGMFWFHPLV